MGGSLLGNPTVLLTAAGLAWGLIETMTSQGTQTRGAAPGPPQPHRLLAAAAAAGDGCRPGAPPQSDALRLVRLAISAAQADGGMGETERAEIQRRGDRAGDGRRGGGRAGAADAAGRIVAGVTDAGQRATLCGLAFTLVRADEQVNGAERIYLAQLANLLGLDPAAVAKIEAAASAQIDQAPEEGSGALAQSPSPEPGAYKGAQTRCHSRTGSWRSAATRWDPSRGTMS